MTRADKNPACPNCGKPLKKALRYMKVEGDKIPSKFHNTYPLAAGKDEDEGRKILAIRTSHSCAGNYAVWLGDFDKTNGSFCCRDCIIEFAEAAHKAGFKKKLPKQEKASIGSTLIPVP